MEGINANWQVDLADMHGIALYHGKIRNSFTEINVFFKFAWAITVHFKNAKAFTAAIGHVDNTANRSYTRRRQTDKEKEFFSSELKRD